MYKLILSILTVYFIAAPGILVGREYKLTLIHTNDMHSHLQGFSPNIDYTPLVTGDDGTEGGWGRIAAIISETRQSRKNPLLIVDAGDFMMGSLYHTISREFAMELRLLKKMGYEAVTLGNHEFDLMPGGLSEIIRSGIEKGGIPKIVSANLIFSSKSTKDDPLEDLYTRGIIEPFTIIEKDGLRIGIFGLMGKDAAGVAPFAKPVKFDDPVKTARKMVAVLKNEKNADIIVCISHSGLHEKKKKSEDEILAKEVTGIDVIVSGHSHTELPQPLSVNNSIIVQSWKYGKRVGILDLTINNGRVKISRYNSVVVDDSIKGDEEIVSMIEEHKGVVNKRVLKYYQTGFDSIIAHTDFDLLKVDDESNLGNFLADSVSWYSARFVYGKKKLKQKKIISILSGGVIRDDIIAGKTGFISVADLFRTIPLGVGMDGSIAYPLIAIYIYASDIKKALEITTSIYPMKGSNYFLQISGIKFRYNPNRMIFDRVTDIWVGNEEDGYVPLDYSKSNRKLYMVVADIYNATFLKVVGNFTWGILEIIPRDVNGNPVNDLKKMRIDADSKKEGIQEVKEWAAALEFARNFRDTNGDNIPDVPVKYKGRLQRIVRHASWNPYSLLKGGNYLTWAAFGIIILLTAAISTGAVFTVKRIIRRRSS